MKLADWKNTDRRSGFTTDNHRKARKGLNPKAQAARKQRITLAKVSK